MRFINIKGTGRCLIRFLMSYKTPAQFLNCMAKSAYALFKSIWHYLRFKTSGTVWHLGGRPTLPNVALDGAYPGSRTFQPPPIASDRNSRNDGRNRYKNRGYHVHNVFTIFLMINLHSNFHPIRDVR